MGNRAVITTSTNRDAIGIYIHWNGGRDSIEAFLKYCELKRYREDDLARLAQVIGNFFGGTRIIEIDKNYALDCDNWDNGMYIIKDWKIVGRRYMYHEEQRNYDIGEMLLCIDSHQPECEQISEFLKAEPLPVECFGIGDKVIWIYDGKPVKATVIGIGKDVFVNGHNVKGIPYTDRYTSNLAPENNINNYLIGDGYRIFE